MNMYGTIGTSNPEYLLADPQGADKIAVPCKPGQGTFKRGAILYRGSDGLYDAATASELDGSKNLVVLDEEVDTGNGNVAENGSAFRAGRFIDGKVILNGGGTLTAANKLALRQQGIVLNPMESTDTFDNGGHTVTYKANNGASPAEPDVVKEVAAGGTHTVLANSVTGFTAPSTKSFSKWNTKDDGSGTDYAAAATLTPTENVTLFAIWA